jgi:hypothetical protein
MKSTLILCLGISFLMLACNSQSSKQSDKGSTKNETTAVSESKSPVGTYSAVENGKPMQFILNSDGTGYENYKGTEKRPFTWKSKGGKVFFTYNGEPKEWELPINLDKGEINYGSLIYKKEK